METNIQSLLDKIYQDGINKSKQESERILQIARKEAEAILAEARKEADSLLENARKEVQILRESTEADLKQARTQLLSTLRTEITNLVAKKLADPVVKEMALDIDFMKTLVLKITEVWIKQGVLPENIELVLSDSDKEKWNQKLKSSIDSKLAGMQISTSGIKAGFQIQRKDQGFRIDFTEDALREFFRSYLKKKTADWLFKE